MTSSEPSPRSAPRRLLSPALLLLLLVLAGWSAFSVLPVVGRRLGMADVGMWFIDSYAVLAASDAVTAGLDPFPPNPLDVYGRAYSYSRWWFVLGRLGLTRQDNFLVGGCWVMAFLLSGMLLLRPRSMPAAALGAVVFLSPPVLLAINRANNELVVFALLAGGLLAMREAKPWRLTLFALTLVLATGLKFYPFIAGIALLLVRPPRRGWMAAGLGLLAAGLALLSVWPDFQKAVFPASPEGYTFGAAIAFRGLGWRGLPPLLAAVGLLGLAAAVCLGRGWSVRVDEVADDLRARLAFAVGAALLVGCFLAGISYAYRLIFVIFLVPWLWRQGHTAAARWTGLLLVATLWLEGLYCLGINVFIGPVSGDRLAQLRLAGRFLSQPVAWAAMALLAGSLLGMLRAAVRDGRKAMAR